MKAKMKALLKPVCLDGTKKEIIKEIELVFAEYEELGYTNLYIEEHYPMDEGPTPFLYMNGEWEEEE